MNMMVQGNLAHSPSNSDAIKERKKEFFNEVRKFGREKGLGEASVSRLMQRAVRAANDGTLSSQKDKEGNDDAKLIHAEFVSEAGGKAIDERSTAGLRKIQSYLRQCIKVGEMTTCDPVKVVDRAIEITAERVKAKLPARKLTDAIVATARVQQTLDHDMTDDEITAAVSPSEKPEKDVTDYLKRVQTMLDKLITGEAGFTDTSTEVRDAHDSIKKRLATLVTGKEVAETMAKAEKLGLKVVTTEGNIAGIGEGDSGLDVSENPDRIVNEETGLTAREQAENERTLRHIAA